MNNNIKTATLENGITILGEEINTINSGAFSILVPIGSAYDIEQNLGITNILCGMFEKGGGLYDKQKLSNILESIGAQYSNDAGLEYSSFTGALLGENLEQILQIYANILLAPHLNQDDLENIKLLALQELRHIEDNPSTKAHREFFKNFYPGVFGRSITGTEDGIKSISRELLLEFHKNHFLPQGTIIAIAGKFNWNEIVDSISTNFKNWSGDKQILTPEKFTADNKNIHIEQDANQLQIFLGFPNVDITHPDTYIASVINGVLSGGMHGRLFVEVREKRGLVYTVSSSYSSNVGRGATIIYAGTTPEKGQETLDVILTELDKLKDGATDEELERAKADLKSRIVLACESSYNRANSIVLDFWRLKNVRSIEYIKQQIDAVTNDEIKRFLNENRTEPKTLLTLGKVGLKM